MKKLIIKTPKYWEQACHELSLKDKKMANIILTYSNLKIKSHGDAFTTLARAIVGQQISVVAASSIWRKLYYLTSTNTDKNIKVKLLKPTDVLKNFNKLNAAGLSTRKRDYIYNLAQHFKNNKGFSEQLLSMSDEEITTTLISFSGIGKWTVNMFKIFCLMRPDVFPDKDLGLINAITTIYKIKNDDYKLENIITLSRKWKPWRTVASWYLWCSVDPEPVYY